MISFWQLFPGNPNTEIAEFLELRQPLQVDHLIISILDYRRRLFFFLRDWITLYTPFYNKFVLRKKIKRRCLLIICANGAISILCDIWDLLSSLPALIYLYWVERVYNIVDREIAFFAKTQPLIMYTLQFLFKKKWIKITLIFMCESGFFLCRYFLGPKLQFTSISWE